MSSLYKNDPQKMLLAGNWKMNNTLAESVSLAKEIKSILHDRPEIFSKTQILVCPSYVHLTAVAKELDGAPIHLGAQNCSFEPNGAHTGEISVEMLSDLGCEAVILGHSERRQNCGETNEGVKKKASQAHTQKLATIICVGETLEERESGREYEIVEAQLAASLPETATLDNLVIAYEPVWAIGTGKVASVEEVRAMHEVISLFIQNKLEQGQSIPVLYGGSVKPDNANALAAIQHVDGFLVGGASLNASSFIEIASNI